MDTRAAALPAHRVQPNRLAAPNVCRLARVLKVVGDAKPGRSSWLMARVADAPPLCLRERGAQMGDDGRSRALRAS